MDLVLRESVGNISMGQAVGNISMGQARDPEPYVIGNRLPVNTIQHVTRLTKLLFDIKPLW